MSGLRRNQASLTAAEKQSFVNAVLQLKANKTYDVFVQQHTNSSNVTNAHRGPAFLPWHRYFLNQFESALQAVDSSVTLPYWDWTVDNQPSSSLWSASFLGGNGRASDGMVTDGPFGSVAGNWPITVFPPGWPAYLQRQFANLIPTLPTSADVDQVMAVVPYDSSPWDMTPVASFRNQLEGWVGPNIHNRVHVWVGGSMLPMSSPNDPVFFMHHANVDRLWAYWQAIHPGLTYVPVTGAATGHNLNDPMRPWGGAVTPASVLDERALGYQYDSDLQVDTVELVCQGALPGPRYLSASNGVSLVSQSDATTKWGRTVLPNGNWILRAPGANLQFLDGLTDSGTVCLANTTEPPYTGTKWEPALDSNNFYMLECQGHIPTITTWLDGLTATGGVQLAPQTGGMYTGTHWQVNTVSG